MKLLIHNGCLVDPSGKTEGVVDILVEDGVIVKISRTPIPARGTSVVDAAGKLVFPGLIDAHCHLREPGREDEETIRSGSFAAVSGGFTTICCMPNTSPALDNKVAIRFVYNRARDALCEVLPIGTITIGRDGQNISPFGEMVQEGAAAFSDDGNCVLNSLVMRRALEYSRLFGKPVISHAEDQNLSKNGLMNEGFLSTKLGLTGIPRQAEEIMVSRDIALADLTGGRLHLAHVTTVEAVDLVRRAKKRNLAVTCEAAVHHFTLTEDAVTGYDTNAKVSPPLRTEKDLAAVREGLKDGTIDCIVTDHAPHSEEEKEIGFEHAPFGMIGFETALPLAFRLTGHGFSPRQIISYLTTGPARVMGIDRGEIAEGKRADIVVFDPSHEWVFDRTHLKSKSRNSPFLGWKLKGKVLCTIAKGAIVYQSS